MGGGVGVAGLVGQDGGQVAVAEPARGGGLAQRAVHRGGIVQRGQLDRLGHLGPDPRAARGGGLGQPQPRPVTEGQELFLGNSFRAWSPPQRPFGCGGKCASATRGLPGVVRCVAGDLDRAGVADVHDHDLLAVAAAPTPSAPHRVCGTEYWPCSNATIGGVRRHRAGHPERGGVGVRGQRVQPGAFLGQHLGRGRGGSPGARGC